MGNSGIRKLFF